MTDNPQMQSAALPIDGMVNDPLTVEYWREQYRQAFARFENVTTLANELGDKDAEFAGATGWLRVRNIHAGRGGLRITAKAVGLMNELRPKPVETPSRVRRQKLIKQ